jgi:hypothetical protein
LSAQREDKSELKFFLGPTRAAHAFADEGVRVPSIKSRGFGSGLSFPNSKNMAIQIYRKMILASGVLILLGLNNHAPSQTSQAHRHIRIGQSGGMDIPEFSMVETSLEAGAKKRILLRAATGSMTRLLFPTRASWCRTGLPEKYLRLRACPWNGAPFQT